MSANVLIGSPRGQRLGRQWVTGDRRLEQLLDFGQPLDVIHVGVRGNQRLAIRQGEVELTDNLHDLVDGLVEADIDQQPLALVVHQVNIAAQAAPAW